MYNKFDFVVPWHLTYCADTISGVVSDLNHQGITVSSIKYGTRMDCYGKSHTGFHLYGSRAQSSGDDMGSCLVHIGYIDTSGILVIPAPLGEYLPSMGLTTPCTVSMPKDKQSD